MNTNEQIMAWMMDTYSMNVGAPPPAWSPANHGPGRLAGPPEATGRGVFTVGVEAAHHIGLPIEGARVAVQGFGNVGGIAASCLPTRARSSPCWDHTGTIFLQETAWTCPPCWPHVAATGGVGGFPAPPIWPTRTSGAWTARS